MALKETLEEIKNHISFKKDTFVGDIVIVGMPAGISYAIVRDIKPDHKKDWYNIEFSLLMLPPVELTWTLRQPQMSGEIFTIDGDEHFMVAVDFTTDQSAVSSKDPES